MFGLGITRLRRVLLGIAIATVSQTLAVSVNYANAQITPDGTLPNNSSVKLEGNTFNITGGTQAGSNLFHSFGQFSVPTGGTAFFNNAVDIQNIIGRVTGGSISNIDGLIRANGAANLFFLNPSGIVFGPNASLNVGGSFLASTASSLKFADGFEFSATAPQSTPLLTISVPIGLQFGANPGSIQNQSVATNSSGESVGLQVEPGKTLALVGGDVRLDGGLLQAANGRVELAGVASSGTVNLQVNNNNLSLNFPVDIPRADVSLLNAAKVDVTGNGAGTVGITARSIDISGGSKISAGLNKEAGISYVPGNITLNATGVVTIDQLSRITNMNAEGTTANAGNISIQAGDIFVDSRASVPDEKERPTTLDTQSSGQGRGGNVSLSATGKITLIGQDANVLDRVIYTYNEQGLGGGDISLSAGDSISLENAYLQAGGGKANGGSISLFGNNSISIADNSSLISGTVGGNAGDITIKSAGNVSIQNSLLVSGVRGDLTGQAKAGDINISGQSVFVTDGSEFIPSLLSGSGKSGNININAKDTVEISGKDPILSPPRQDRSTTYLYTTLTTQSNKDAYGAAGNININTDKLRVLDGATIAADTKSDFRGGDIMVNAKVVELFDGGQILTTARSRGNAGNIFLKVGDNIVLSGTNPNYADDPPRFNRTVEAVSASSGLFANTEAGSSGNGGEINLTGGSLFLNNNSQITAQSGGTGNAGKINIDASTIEAVSGGKLLTTTSGSGNAGNINVNLSDRFSLSDTGTGLFANTEAGSSGNGGTIEINSTNLSINNGAGIGINSLGQGSAGRFLNINARDEISLANSSITSGLGNQAIGQGGEINLTARSLSLSDGAKVIASTSGQGNAGRINAQVKDRVTLTNNSQIQSTVESTATGNGTQISISGRSLFLNNNSQITAQSGGTGNAGNINIDASTIEAVSGGKLLTTTSGSGNAGNISVNVGDRFSLSDTGTGLFANTEVGSSGNGGSIFIDPRTVLIENGAGVTVGSRGTGIGGNIQIQADSLKLDNRAFLSAETASTQGGNIEIQSEGLLLLRRNSLISTNAGNERQGGNGGNITINSPNGFIVAVPNENSDISANAFTGSGGRVNITASGIYGIESRPRPTELSDITASSERGVQGTIDINTPIVDPNRGLLQLSAGVVNTPRLVSSSCAAFDKKGSEFIVTGRGGLPLSPDDFLSSDVIWTDTRLTATTAQNPDRTPAAKLSIPKAVQIVPATGWVFNGKGEVTLISSAPDATASVSPPTCAKQ
ncbi:filamentous hemagglutinin outer membrane protein [Tolypothrix sp. NIES-4075]|uniref:two-partner secretion domain-containing protein n=1 Tax=Tolypothrix sp. NIES-4075 TaxID=2005459 RepID=UPI000B5C5F30|nr:filamentous hemagglutinin N-terminal domain-containing protein [Tolypothrix sp. NIES-4075]GAX45033.1 filamentous hemagglutinin outer membrane protein [Tolypothrix sp. NIES-4075]